jgi:hypothetical protein
LVNYRFQNLRVQDDYRTGHGLAFKVARHWRGELSLGVSYWINGFLANFGAGFAIRAIGAALDAEYDPIPSFLGLVAIWVVVALFAVWQVIGIWRAARNHVARGRGPFWAFAARVMMVIGCLQLGVTFAKKGWPQIQEAFDIATGDPSVGPYEIRLLASGSEVEFAGGIQFGSTNELRKLLDETPELNTIHLNSHGGRTAEARRMRDLIRQKRLATYTSTECLSACTIAYLGGEQRFIHPRAKLGFHKGTFPGLSEAEIRRDDDQSKRDAVQAGIAVTFVEKAYSTPHEDMWIPSTSELLASGYVTHVSNGQFGLSGFGSQPSRQALAENLREVPIFAAVAAADSIRFEKMVDLYADGVSVGRPETAVFSTMRAMMSDLVQIYAPTASDEALIALASVLVEELALIGRASADACHDFLFPTEGNYFDIRNYVGTDVQQRDLAATEMIIRTGTVGAKPKLTDSEIDWLKNQLIKRIERKHGDDAVTKLAAIGTSAVTRAETCRVVHILYSEALNMPLQFRAKVIRHLFSQ